MAIEYNIYPEKASGEAFVWSRGRQKTFVRLSSLLDGSSQCQSTSVVSTGSLHPCENNCEIVILIKQPFYACSVASRNVLAGGPEVG